MRILHTSDWHLGQTLHEVPRDFEHGRFLSWLLDTLAAEQVDALLITGDIFDSANPPPAAQRAYYDFLARCRQRLPLLDIVVIGGNHDSPGRLDAPASILRAVGVTAIGGLPLRADGSVDADRAIVPLYERRRHLASESGAAGHDPPVAAWLLAVPFLRRADLPDVADVADVADVPEPVDAADGAASAGGSADPADPAPAVTPALADRLVSGVRAIYHGLYAEACRRRAPGQPILATGHCYMSGGQLSELSERQIQLGNQALPIDIFPAGLSYVALGHLHLAQPVAGYPHIRYAGSPIPLSLSEKNYRHQVVLLDTDGDAPAVPRILEIPRFVQMKTVPEQHLLLPTVLDHLRALPHSPPPGARDEERPYLEVRVLREPDMAGLRKEIETALSGAWVRLLRINLLAPDPVGPDALGDQLPRRSLRELDPAEVFNRCYDRSFHDDPPAELLACFSELLEAVRQEAA